MILLHIVILISGYLPNVSAELPDVYYKDHAYSVKQSYYNLLGDINGAILKIEDALSGLSFDNNDAKKKIEQAWSSRYTARSQHDSIKQELEETTSYLNNNYFAYSYVRFIQMDDQLYSNKETLYTTMKTIKEARDLEKQYQEKKRSCFLFWCSEIKNTYGVLDDKIKKLESQLSKMETEFSNLQTKKSSITQSLYQTEIEVKNYELKNLQTKRIQEQQKAETERQQLEEKIRQEQQRAYEEEQRRLQEQREYEYQIQQEKQTQLQILASTNPLLKKIMTGHITFWVQPLPSYVAPDVAYEVERIFDVFESWSGVSRVYDEGSSDIRITWIKEFNPSTGGLYWQSYVQVGLGSSSGCYGKWQPFVAHTVRIILWHEIGHAMGYGHSSDSNNIMYPYHPHYHYKEFDDDVFIKNDAWASIPICLDGRYTISLSGNSKSEGFAFYVITPDTDEKTFFDENSGGRHYPDCREKGEWVSYTITCSVTKGSKLLIVNPYEIGGSAINVDVETRYVGNMEAYDMTWDPDVLREPTEYLVYLNSLR